MTKFNVGAFVAIFDKKDRILLSHRRDLDLWNLPGGNLEEGELPTEAAVRETKEETGLKIKIKELVGVYGKPHRDELAFVFLGKVKGGKLTKTKEADKHRFFKLKNIPENTIPKHVERVKDANRGNDKIAIYNQKSMSGRKLLKKLRKKR